LSIIRQQRDLRELEPLPDQQADMGASSTVGGGFKRP